MATTTTSTTTASWSSSAPAPAAARSANELAQKGIKVVAARGRQAAEHRHLRQRRVGELPPARLARQAHHLGQLAGRARLPEPAGLDLQDRRRHHRRTGPAPRCASRSTSSRRKTDLRRRRRRQPARLADHAGRARAVLRQGRGQDGRDPHQRHPRPAGQQQLQGAVHRAPSASATRRSTPAAWRSTASRATTGRPASRSASASRAASRRREVVDALHRDPGSDRDRQARAAARDATALQIQHDDAGKVTGVLYADKDGKQHVQKARVVCVAGNSIESPRLLLNSASAKFPDGLANSSGQVGRNYMRHTDRLGLRRVRQAGAHVPRHDHGRASSRTRRATTRSAASSAATSWRPCRLGLPFMAAFLDPGRLGPRASRARWSSTRTWPACGSSARTCRARPTGSRCNTTEKDKFGMPIPNVHFDDHPNDIAMRSHAYPAGQRGLRGGGRDARSTRRRPIPRRTISAPTG